MTPIPEDVQKNPYLHTDSQDRVIMAKIVDEKSNSKSKPIRILFVLYHKHIRKSTNHADICS